MTMICCDDISTTIKKPLQLISRPHLTLPADGESTMLITAKHTDYMLANQTVNFTTTDGYLYSFPVDGFDGGVKSLEVFAVGDSAIALLRSSKIPRSNVILGVKVNNLITTRTVTFTRVCPEEIALTLNDNELNHASNDRPILTIDLRKEVGNISDSTRVKLTADPSGLIDLPTYVYINRTGTVQINALNTNTGSVTITVELASTGCTNSVSETIPIEIKN